MTTARRRAVVVGAAAIVAAVSGCGSSSSSAGSASTGAAGGAAGSGGNAVMIQNFSFQPGMLSVKVGTTVTWTNGDSSTHTATSDKGAPAAFDTGRLDQNAKGTFTFATAGTYTYHCDIHQYMKGTITVTG